MIEVPIIRGSGGNTAITNHLLSQSLSHREYLATMPHAALVAHDVWLQTGFAAGKTSSCRLREILLTILAFCKGHGGAGGADAEVDISVIIVGWHVDALSTMAAGQMVCIAT